MTEQEYLFAEFPPAEKASWLEKVEQDLKGRPLDDLRWQLEEQIKLDPFYHPDDFDQHPPSLQGARTNNNWTVGEYIDVREEKQANAAALEGLKGGAESILFRFFHAPSAEQFELLLKGIELPFIALHLQENYSDKAPWALFEQLRSFVEKKGYAPERIRGGIDFDPLLDWGKPPIGKLAEAIRYCGQHMPGWRPLQVNARRFHSGPEATSLELAYTIAKGSEYLSRLSEQGLEAASVNQHLQFSMVVSKSYFVEIAKLRALRLLWANVLKAYGAEGQAPFVSVHLAEESQDDNPNTNMIRASTQSMSAVIGGADELFVLPSNYALKEASTSFSRRIARNVQHLLKMESHLHRVVDAGAGSFYIEKLTEKLAGQAWTQFQQLESSGAFR